MSSQSTKNDPKTNAFKKLDNNGQNYSIWAPRCHMVLQGLELWTVVDPTVPNSVRPITHPAPIPVPIPTPSTSSMLTLSTGSVPAPTPTPMLDAAEWDRRNMKALSLLLTSIDDTLFHLISVKTTTRDVWTALSTHYNGLGALDASILLNCLHQFQLDDT